MENGHHDNSINSEVTEGGEVHTAVSYKGPLEQSNKDDNNNNNNELTLSDLPIDILIQITSYLRPSDVFRLARTSRALHNFLLQNDHTAALVAHAIIHRRYPILEKCIRLPVLVSSLAPAERAVLCDENRLRTHEISRQPYFHHVTPPDPHLVCTCVTCVLRWHTLCLAVDLAHWQDTLDAGSPAPVILWGERPAWNVSLLEAHAAVVRRAVCVSDAAAHLWHAVILQEHLRSTVRSVMRHGVGGAADSRVHYRLTPEEAASGTDGFLEGLGPVTKRVPFHRDQYKSLEAYLPNRSWVAGDEGGGWWEYLPADQHEKDLAQLMEYVRLREETTTTTTTTTDGAGWGGEEEVRGNTGLLFAEMGQEARAQQLSWMTSLHEARAVARAWHR
ncbi:hypothetical protein M406DRAFT_265445 [Cryphonectria parasitica EP155]|uniref:F-box domain-containing protein n=1 Tax=Cryphonectria parasitica (strain ATCC 38755 / EP155) TaxID=660469 RepID=A0A9P4XUU5_CRYP1|nr:uncharacterized protein M406DRAFT_265445 [Cryphonectria parasitica EP155]KAF3761414.1 hypothetical protein M406DRAFT_265445 [Cryphonectria parasitica EP155]